MTIKHRIYEEYSETGVFFCYLPLDSSSLLLLLEPDVLELQRAGDEADLAALLH